MTAELPSLNSQRVYTINQDGNVYSSSEIRTEQNSQIALIASQGFAITTAFGYLIIQDILPKEATLGLAFGHILLVVANTNTAPVEITTKDKIIFNIATAALNIASLKLGYVGAFLNTATTGPTLLQAYHSLSS
jgi:hypothetical protein